MIFRSDWDPGFSYPNQRDSLLAVLGKYFSEVIVVTSDRQARECKADIPWPIKGEEWLKKITKKTENLYFLVNFTSINNVFYSDQIICGIAFPWDVDVLPEDYDKILSKMDFFIVPSKFHENILKEKFSQSNIFLVPVFRPKIPSIEKTLNLPVIDVDLSIGKGEISRFMIPFSDIATRERPVFYFSMDDFFQDGFNPLISEWIQYRKDGGIGVLIIKTLYFSKTDNSSKIIFQIINTIYRLMRRNRIFSLNIYVILEELPNLDEVALLNLVDASILHMLGKGLSERILNSLFSGKIFLTIDNPVILPFLPEGYPLVFRGQEENCSFFRSSSYYSMDHSWHIPLEGELSRGLKKFNAMQPQEIKHLESLLANRKKAMSSLDSLPSNFLTFIGYSR
ncbi:hypothetical protein [Leptospirillum ferriphilum]|uniref:Uncharacterized protein n=1 Tax=Leptospirillum ferriphilum (strain ML-04) TaxID=1048260 RepID=J9ZBQ6_LEPFM|nr:hypothetical protein [Leptospirillum ferriphilum]AFS53995.1 hypothetical protein LFML04_1795 [Leptospirillum ferriphilum ML-04]